MLIISFLLNRTLLGVSYNIVSSYILFDFKSFVLIVISYLLLRLFSGWTEQNLLRFLIYTEFLSWLLIMQIFFLCHVLVILLAIWVVLLDLGSQDSSSHWSSVNMLNFFFDLLLRDIIMFLGSILVVKNNLLWRVIELIKSTLTDLARWSISLVSWWKIFIWTEWLLTAFIWMVGLGIELVLARLEEIFTDVRILLL